MSSAVKNIMLRAIRKRLAAGESLEDIWTSYPRLTQEEQKEIEMELEKK